MEYEIFDEPRGEFQMGETPADIHRGRDTSAPNVDPREAAEAKDRAEHIPDQED